MYRHQMSMLKDKALETMVNEHSQVLKKQEKSFQNVLEKALAASKQDKDRQQAAELGLEDMH